MITSLMFILVFADGNKNTSIPKKAYNIYKDSNLKKAIEGLLFNYGELKQAEYEVKQKFQDLLKSRSGYLPEIELSTFQGYRQTRRAIGFENEQGPFKSWGDESEAGITIKQNITNGGRTTGEVKSAEGYIYQAVYGYYDKRSKTMADLLDVILKIKLQEQNIKFAESAKKSSSILLKELASSLDLKNRKDYEQAKENYAISSINLEQEKSKYQSLKTEFLEKTGFMFFDNLELTLPHDLPKDYNEAKRKMLLQNPSILQAKSKIQYVEGQMIQARSSFYPSISVEGGMDMSSHGQRYSLQNPSSDRRHEPESKVFNTRVGIRIVYPIFSGGKDLAGVRQASQGISAAKKELLAAIQQAEINLKQIWENYQFARENQKDYEVRVKSMKFSWESTDIERKEGIRGARDVIDEETRYVQTQKDQAENNKLLILSAWQLKMLLGELTPQLFTDIKFFDPISEYRTFRSLKYNG